MKNDGQPAETVAQRRAAAEAQLWKRMEERGMTREGGWRVVTFTRDTRSGHELVLRPMHIWHESPYDLDHVFAVTAADAACEPTVTPEPLQRDSLRRY